MVGWRGGSANGRVVQYGSTELALWSMAFGDRMYRYLHYEWLHDSAIPRPTSLRSDEASDIFLLNTVEVWSSGECAVRSFFNCSYLHIKGHF